MQELEEQMKEEEKDPSTQDEGSTGDTLTPSEEPTEEAQGELERSESGEDGEDGPDPTEVEEEEAQPQEDPAATEATTTEPTVEAEPQEKMLTQSQVNELVGRARKEGRESMMRELFGRYGVSGDEELNDVFGRGQAYDSLNDEFTTQSENYKNAMAENALLKSKIDESRWEDVKLILGGKGLDVSAENILAALATHPEWRSDSASLEQAKTPLTPDMAEQIGKESATAQPKSVPGTLRKLGTEATPPPPQISEEELVRKLYGM